MPIFNAPEAPPDEPDRPDDDPLRRFRNWRGFMAAAVAVNLLFIYGMLNNMGDPGVAIWFKVLAWLPFNAIATALYLVFLIKLGKASEANNQTGGAFYALLSVFMICANWIMLINA